MRSVDALTLAFGMLNCPDITRRARRSPLPKGVCFLLEVAAEEPEALRDASALTGRTAATLKEAAGFFIEQVLFGRNGDHYRTLGGSGNTPRCELRRNMALIMRWLHPDVVSSSQDAHSFDKRLYVGRVSEAWEAIKTDERRAAYDASLRESGKGEGTRNIPVSRAVVPLSAFGNLATPPSRTTHRKERVIRAAKRERSRRPIFQRAIAMTENITKVEKVCPLCGHQADCSNTAMRVMTWMFLLVTVVVVAAGGLFGRQ